MATSLVEELNNFLKEYELQTNTHNFDNVSPLISKDASYYFSDGVFVGIEEIRKAFNKTWEYIQNEKYSIKELNWIVISEIVAVCTYQFQWEGNVNGEVENGQGRGTNVLVRMQNGWKMKHEHLSS